MNLASGEPRPSISTVSAADDLSQSSFAEIGDVAKTSVNTSISARKMVIIHPPQLRHYNGIIIYVIFGRHGKPSFKKRYFLASESK